LQPVNHNNLGYFVTAPRKRGPVTKPRQVLALIWMPITTLLDLRDKVAECGLLEFTCNISIEEQLITFLWMIGHGAPSIET